jgi:hypothetical protein
VYLIARCLFMLRVRAGCWMEPVSVLCVGLGVGYRPFGCCVHVLQVCDAICFVV